jgi:hypothetical protein
MYIFTFGQLLQAAAFLAGVRIANSLLESEDIGGRIMLFPHAAMLLVFFYAYYTRRVALTAMASIILFGTGSKVVIAIMGLLAVLAGYKNVKFKEIIINILSIGLIAGLLIYVNPTALERLTDFIAAEKLEDTTREYEVYYAQKAFFSGFHTMAVGVGFGNAITPGVESTDPRWFENSKYDIENGFWGLLSKLGVLGTIWYLSFFSFMPRNRVFVAIMIIEVFTAFASSFLFFARFEGPYLIAWSMIINALLLKKKPSPGAEQ